MERKLIIEDFGKIKKAEIDISPLTLFVGDNNSGKSYLLSLIWAIYAAEGNSAIFRNAAELLMEDYMQVYQGVYDCISKVREGENQEIKIPSKVLVEILNKLLERNKDKFVAGIFNSEQVTIGKLAVLLEREFDVKIAVKKKEGAVDVFCKEGYFSISFRGKSIVEDVQYVTEKIFNGVLRWFFRGKAGLNGRSTVYLPPRVQDLCWQRTSSIGLAGRLPMM